MTGSNGWQDMWLNADFRQGRIGSAAGVAAIHAVLGYALIVGLGFQASRSADESLKLFNLAIEPLPEPAEPPIVAPAPAMGAPATPPMPPLPPVIAPALLPPFATAPPLPPGWATEPALPPSAGVSPPGSASEEQALKSAKTDAIVVPNASERVMRSL